MVSRLYIPGLADYGRCKESFLRAEELLAQGLTDESRTELSSLRDMLEGNPGAVDFLKAEFGEGYVNVYLRLSDACLPAFLLDEHAADGGRKRLPIEWYDYWAAVTDGRVMASMGDLYGAFKAINKMHSGSEQEMAKAKSLLLSLRDDFDWSGKGNWLIAGTRLFHFGNSLETRIVQHYRCDRPELIKETVLEVPVYRGTAVEKIVGEQRGLAYFQALFDTQDDGEEILQNVEFVSGKRRDDIVGWTANTSTSDTQYTRASHPKRAVGFDCGADQFHVLGDNIYGSPGCSRGVRRGGRA